MDHSILYSFFFFENHRQLRWYRFCGCCFILVWCTDVKSSDLIITLSPNNFTTFQKGIRTRTHIDINNKYLQIFASIKCSHMNITVCVWRKKWKLLVIEKYKKNWLEWYCNIVCVLDTVICTESQRVKHINQTEWPKCSHTYINGSSIRISADFLLLFFLFRFYFRRTI